MQISIIAALGRDRGIGYEGKLLWRIPEDMKRFKALTMGKPIIMGRKTFESIGKPLPGRTNIVLSTNQKWSHEGAHRAHYLDEAITMAKYLDAEETFIIGGARVYEEALPKANRLCLTQIDDVKPADVFFPLYYENFSRFTPIGNSMWEGIRYSFVDYTR